MPFVQEAPPEWNVLLAEQAKPRTGLHVTDMLGCARRRAGLVEGWPVDLSRMEARLTGTILHEALADVNPHTAEMPVAGELFGHKIVGSVDRLERHDGGVFTCDYKGGEDKGAGRNLPVAPYAEEVWQQEAYRYLLAWNLDEPLLTQGWRIYYRWRKAWYVYQHVGPIWAETRLAEFRPHGGAFTTREIAGLCGSGLPANSLPLVGATMPMGRGTICDWCELQAPCGQKGVEVDL